MDVYCRSNISALNKWKKIHAASHTHRYEHTHTLKDTEVFSNNC